MNFIKCSPKDWYLNLAKCVLNYGANYIRFCDNQKALELRFTHCEDIYWAQVLPVRAWLGKPRKEMIPAISIKLDYSLNFGRHAYLLYFCKYQPQDAIQYLESLQ